MYTNQSNGSKYYLALQIRDNKIRPVIAELISEFGVDPRDQLGAGKNITENGMAMLFSDLYRYKMLK